MNFNLTFKPDENYYKEAYAEIISSLKFKKYEPIFATIMVLFGIGLYFFDSDLFNKERIPSEPRPIERIITNIVIMLFHLLNYC